MTQGMCPTCRRPLLPAAVAPLGPDGPPPDAGPAEPGPGNLGIVLCSDCGTPHHRVCFEYAGMCSRGGCPGMRYSSLGVGSRDVTTIPLRPADEAPADPPVRLILDQETIEERGCRLARVLTGGIAMASLAVFVANGCPERLLVAPVFSGLLAVVAWIYARTTDCYVVVDPARRLVLDHKKVAGRVRLIPKLPFEEICSLVLETRERVAFQLAFSAIHAYSDEHTLWAVDRNNQRHLLMGPYPESASEPYQQVKARTADLGRLLGARVDTPPPAFRPLHEPIFWVTIIVLMAPLVVSLTALLQAPEAGPGWVIASVTGFVMAIRAVPTGSDRKR